MSGHSKWNNIKRKKGAADAKRGAVFTKIGREIQVAVKMGGPDPDVNSQLKDVIAKAKSNNMPNDTIQRSIQKAAGAGANENYESVTYEGYGPAGVAVLVECLTDNRNRTAGEVRHSFDKHDGNLGTNGCVSFMFKRQGSILLAADDTDEDALMLEILECGGEDLQAQKDEDDELVGYCVTTAADNYYAVKTALEAAGHKILESQLERVPDNYISVKDPEQVKKLENLIDALEENDDVQAVYHNWDEEE